MSVEERSEAFVKYISEPRLGKRIADNEFLTKLATTDDLVSLIETKEPEEIVKIIKSKPINYDILGRYVMSSVSNSGGLLPFLMMTAFGMPNIPNQSEEESNKNTENE